jgi:hypothetical protein
MDFTPGERAVLAQMRVLFKASGPDQQLKALTSQWPPMHYETYRQAYTRLVAKGVIRNVDAQVYRITDAGLTALGVMPIQRGAHVAPVRPQPSQHKAVQPRTGAVSSNAGKMARFAKRFFG